MKRDLSISKTLARLFVSKESIGQFLGAWKSSVRGQGLEVKEIRPFSPGDNPLAAVWSRFAQTGTLYSKLFQEERNRTIYIALDRSGSMFQGKKKMATFGEELFSLIAFAGTESHDQVGAILDGKEKARVIKPNSHRFQAERLIEAVLQPVQLPSSTSLARFFQNGERQGLKRSLLFYISDFIEPTIDWDELFLELSSRHEVVVLKLIDFELDAELPSSIGMATFDPEELPFRPTQITRLHLRHRREVQEKESKRVKEAAQEAHIFLVELDVNQDCLRQLIEVLEKRVRGEKG